MNLFDLVVLIILIASLVYSMFRGMVREIFSLLAYVGGYLMAVQYQAQALEAVAVVISNETLAKVLSFGLIFVVTVVAISLIGLGFRKLIHSTPGLSGMDRTLGGVFGVLKGGVIIIALMFLLQLFPDAYKSTTRGSRFAKHVQEVSDTLAQVGGSSGVLEKLPQEPLDVFKSGYNKLKQIGQNYKDIKLSDRGSNNDKDIPQDEHSTEDKKKLKDILLSLEKE